MAERVLLPAPIAALRALAEAIGLDPSKHRIVSIDIHASARDLPKIAVAMLMDVDGSGRLCEVLKRYRLSPEGEPSTAGDDTSAFLEALHSATKTWRDQPSLT